MGVEAMARGGPRVLANTQPLTVACEFILFLYVYFAITHSHTRAFALKTYFVHFPHRAKNMCGQLSVELFLWTFHFYLLSAEKTRGNIRTLLTVGYEPINICTLRICVHFSRNLIQKYTMKCTTF